MLTGDKQNTALNIATSCNLITSESKHSRIYIIDGDNMEETRTSIVNGIQQHIASTILAFNT